MDYAIHLAILVGIYLILAQSFNLMFGLGNLLNLAHIAAYAIGAYTTALLSTDLEYGFFVCFPVSMFVSGFFSLLIGAIAIKLAHDYFVIGSLAFSAIVTAILINWKSLTRGVLGVPGIPRPEFWGIDFYNNQNFLYLLIAVLIPILGVVYLIIQSHFARSLRAQAENPQAAEALGKALRNLKNDSFIIASFLAGAAGSLFAYYINYIDPSSFSLKEMVFVFSIVVVGRPGSFWGVNLATVFLVLLPEPLRFLELNPQYVGPMRLMLYSLILFFVVYWKRATLFPIQRQV